MLLQICSIKIPPPCDEDAKTELQQQPEAKKQPSKASLFRWAMLIPPQRRCVVGDPGWPESLRSFPSRALNAIIQCGSSLSLKTAILYEKS